MTAPALEQLKLIDFDYHLPESCIAQEPLDIRDQSRLMVVKRNSDSFEHCVFSDIERYLVPGDLLVLNNTKVFPCRLAARKPGGGKAEIFLLDEKERNVWEALVKNGVPAGKKLVVGADIDAEIMSEASDGVRTIRFHGTTDIRILLPEIGKIPLPPYIRRDASAKDRERYQTVFAAHEGAVAAPTAGLHFTESLLARLRDKGVEFVVITLHVGPGTFQPVRVEHIMNHRMLPERYHIEPTSAAAINLARSNGRRIIAVGTTSVRTIETAADEDGVISSGSGSSTLFIHPGYRFKATDGIITNFHLPKSTLLMLVSAFAGRERILSAYRSAISEKYRFYSYGDAMFIG